MSGKRNLRGSLAMKPRGQTGAGRGRPGVLRTDPWSILSSKIKAMPGGCWYWVGALGSAGYGRFHIQGSGHPGKWGLAHRLSWELHVGPIPEGLCVLHHCDVRNCVNPGHLFLGTKGDNARDCARKGRAANRKLSDGEVRRIKARLAAGDRNIDLARRYEIDDSVISVIKTGKAWAWLH